jgi:glutaminase
MRKHHASMHASLHHQQQHYGVLSATSAETAATYVEQRCTAKAPGNLFHAAYLLQHLAKAELAKQQLSKHRQQQRVLAQREGHLQCMPADNADSQQAG